MNEILQQTNSAGKTLVEFAGPMLIQSSVLILILLLADLLLRKKVRAVFRYWIWMLVLVKLVLPTSLSLPMSFGYWFGDNLRLVKPHQRGEAEHTTQILQASPMPTPTQATPFERIGAGPTEPAPMPRPDLAPVEPIPAESVSSPVVSPTPLSWQGALFSVWVAVVAAMSLLLLQRAIFVRALVAQAKAADSSAQNILASCCRRVGVRKKIGLRMSADATSPAVCGLFRPVILVPQNLASNLGSDHLCAVLMHELAHIKRGDLWVNLAQTFLQIIYFYNPLLWLANAIIRRVREQAVDEAVLVAMGEKAQQYPQTLLDVAKLAFKRPTLSLRLIGVVESKSAVAGRIKRILNRPIPKTAKLGILSLLAVVIVAAILLPMAGGAAKSKFTATGGPLDVRLAGVRPDGSDDIYDGSGDKIAGDTFASIGTRWDEESQHRTFIFELPEIEEPILFSPFLGIKPAGAKHGFGTVQHPLLYCSNGKLIYRVGVSFPRTYKRVFNRRVESVDLVLRYYYGPRDKADFVFSGPFIEGRTVRADAGADCELTPEKDRLDYVNNVAAFFKVSSKSRFDEDSVLVYDGSGRRHLAETLGGRSSGDGSSYNYCVEGLTLNSIACVTVGEKPQEKVFKNVAVSYPGRPARQTMEFLDEMCERLGLSGLSAEGLYRYRFKNPTDAIKVIDVVRGEWYVRKVFDAVRYAEPRLDVSSLDQHSREKVRQAVKKWVQAGDPRIRAAGIRLGLMFGWPEFVDSALELLNEDASVYEMLGPQYVDYFGDQVKTDIAWEVGNYTGPVQADQLQMAKNIVLLREYEGIVASLLRFLAKTGTEESFRACWDLAQDDRPWIWWPATDYLKRVYWARLRPLENLPEEMQRRLILVCDASGDSSHLFDVSSSGKDYETVAKDAYSMLPGLLSVELAMHSHVCYNVRDLMGRHLDRQTAVNAIVQFLREISQQQIQRVWASNNFFFGRCCGMAFYIARDFNRWYGVNISNLGTGEDDKGIPRNILQLKQLIAEVLAWYEGHDETSAPPSGGSPFSETLPNGVTVELIGICEHPSEGKQWWGLDGQSIAKPYERLNYTESSREYKRYEIAYRLFGSDDIASTIYSNAAVIGHAGPYPLSQRVKDLNIRHADSAYGAILLLKTDAQSIVLEIGAGRESNWQTLCTQGSPVDKTGTVGTGVVFQPAIEKDSKIYVTIAHQTKDKQIRVVAVDDLGQLHKPEGISNTTSNELGSCQVCFDLLAGQIKEIQFQTQKFRRVTFKNVSLQPGIKTAVEIESEKAAVQVEADKGGEMRSNADTHISLISADEGKDQMNYRWGITRSSPLKVVEGWYEFDETGIRSHGGGGRKIAETRPMQLMLRVSKENGFLLLHRGYTWSSTTADQQADIAAKIEWPAGAVLQTYYLSEPVELTDKLQPVWKGELVQDSTVNSSVVYAVRVVGENVPDELFDAVNTSEALRIGRVWAPSPDPAKKRYEGRTIEQWIAQWDSRSYDDVRAATEALTRIGQPAVPAMIELMKKGGNRATHARTVLGNVGRQAEEALDWLIETALDKNLPAAQSDSRINAVICLSYMTWAADRLLPVFKTIAEDRQSDTGVRRVAISGLQRIGGGAMPILQKIADSEQGEIRDSARGALSQRLAKQGVLSRQDYYTQLVEQDPFDPSVAQYLTSTKGIVNYGKPHALTNKVKAMYRQRLKENPDPELAWRLAAIIQNGLRATELEWAAPTDSSKSKWNREDPAESFATLAEVLELGFSHAEPRSELWLDLGISLAKLRLLAGDWDQMNATLRNLGQEPMPKESRQWLSAPPVDWSVGLRSQWQIADESMRSGSCSLEFRVEKDGKGLKGAHVLVKRAPEPTNVFRTGIAADTLFYAPHPIESYRDSFGYRGNDREETRYAVSEESGIVRFERLPDIPIKIEVLVPTSNFAEVGSSWDLWMEVEPGQFKIAKIYGTDAVSPRTAPAVVTLKQGQTVHYPKLVVRPAFGLNIKDWDRADKDNFVLSWQGLDKQNQRENIHYELEMSLSTPSQDPDYTEAGGLKVESTKQILEDNQWPVGSKGVDGMCLEPGNIYMFEVRAVDESGTVVARWPKTRVWVPWGYRQSNPPIIERDPENNSPIYNGVWFRGSFSYGDGREETLPERVSRFLREQPDAFEHEYVRTGKAWLDWHNGDTTGVRKQLEDLARELPKGNLARGTAVWLLQQMDDNKEPPKRLNFVPDRETASRKAASPPDVKAAVQVETNEVSVEAAPFLKKYEANGFEFEAGFVPDKTEYVWTEPMYYFTYVVKNTGNKTLNFKEGGDYRGGRSESHKITAVDAHGNPVPVPEMWDMGGIAQVKKLEPGEVYTKMLPVSRRLTITGPGVYTVTGKRTLVLTESSDTMFDEQKNLKIPTGNSFQLTIHPYSRERMAKVIENLAAQIWNAGNLAPQPIEYTEPTEMSKANRLHLALSSLTQIKDEAALGHLITMAKTSPPNLRIAAVKCLGEFTDDEAMKVVLETLDDNDETICAAAYEALATMKTDAAIDILIARLPQAQPQVAPAILHAMGRTKSPRVFDLIVESLRHKDTIRRRAAVNGLVAFGGGDAVEALKTCVDDDDMDFREFVVGQLAEPLKQPIDAQWLVPVIRSRKNTDTLGDTPRLLRLYAGEKAVPALLSCLDYENPSIRGYYNWALIYDQGWCQGGLKIPWCSDLNRDDTPGEIDQNRRILKKIRAWVEHYYKYRMDEKSLPEHLYWQEQEKYWGEPVDGISIRVRVNQRVWPEGMPQLVMIDVRGHPNEGSINLSSVPEPLEVEINADWYVRQLPLQEPTMGISAGHGSSFHNLLLDENWRRISDNQPLQLKPGKYTLRIRLSTKTEKQGTGLAISKPIHFEIIKAD